MSFRTAIAVFLSIAELGLVAHLAGSILREITRLFSGLVSNELILPFPEARRFHRVLCMSHSHRFSLSLSLPPDVVLSDACLQVLEMFSELFIHIFDELNRWCKSDIDTVRQQHPFEDLRYARPTLRLTFQEGIQLLRDAGCDGTLHVDDLSIIFIMICSVREVSFHQSAPKLRHFILVLLSSVLSFTFLGFVLCCWRWRWCDFSKIFPRTRGWMDGWMASTPA